MLSGNTLRIAAAIAAVSAVAAPATLADAAARVGKAAPDFTLRTFAGERITSQDLRGQVVVINLWATWCAPCKAEMPMMDEYYRRNRHRGLRIFAMTTEGSVPPYRLKPVQAALAFPLISKIGTDGYPIIRSSVPTTYIIDRAGVVRHAKAGAFSHASFDAAVAPLLAEPALGPGPSPGGA